MRKFNLNLKLTLGKTVLTQTFTCIRLKSDLIYMVIKKHIEIKFKYRCYILTQCFKITGKR